MRASVCCCVHGLVVVGAVDRHTHTLTHALTHARTQTHSDACTRATQSAGSRAIGGNCWLGLRRVAAGSGTAGRGGALFVWHYLLNPLAGGGHTWPVSCECVSAWGRDERETAALMNGRSY